MSRESQPVFSAMFSSVVCEASEADSRDDSGLLDVVGLSHHGGSHGLPHDGLSTHGGGHGHGVRGINVDGS